ncbi:MAG: class I SAM-dependent DNA methyltransferase [Lentisphaeria bacterium]|nr:class I SAM-dependent DNA methyltransferase [Lentisphaeria bacterium]
MTDAQQRNAAKKFAAEWNGRGYEKGETHAFWMELLHMVCGVVNPAQFITFESQVQLGHTSFIDAYIPETKVMIEQKSLDVDLNKPAKQSDGSMLTPYQQAKRYADQLPNSQRPRYIVVCNFQTFHVHDMEHPHDEPEVIQLADLPKEYHRLAFLTDVNKAHLKREMELSIKAGEIVGKIYDCILKHYHDPSAESTLKSLNMLCVRLVFCLYAEDAGIFIKDQFHDYLARFDARDIRRALIDLFKVLDTKEAERDPYLDDDLAAFPYVNGGLFAETDIEIPQFDDTVKELLLAKASDDFNWSEISPTIFGAVFESTLNPETRRSGGMHYTSIENIHKVIDPLFLDDLKAELEEILSSKAVTTRNKKLFAFQDKLSGLTFLDPACGSGNFLTETYLSLRKLENKCLEVINAGQTVLGFYDVIKVSIGQFYGIEINDFAVTVAKTALWIAESQMMKATEDIVHMDLDFLPLKSYANIIEANALRIDWNTVIPKEKLHYIMGNPPFVGYSLQSAEQKADMLNIYVDEKGKPYKTAGKIDYVAAWYFKAAEMMQGNTIRTALVSTNSITQGEQVAGVWKPLYERFGVHIDFAHRTFRWDSEANIKAHVHCVIIGFSTADNARSKVIFDSQTGQTCRTINAYLIDAPNVMLNSLTIPICNVPTMRSGGKPVEGGFLIFSTEEKESFLKQDPDAEKYFRAFMGSDDFISGKSRWCLWLFGVSPVELRKHPLILERIEKVKKFRLSSVKAATREAALRPALFMEIKQPTSDFIMVPATSSEKRSYIPIGFLNKNVIANNAASFVPEATHYHFGILTSSVHMAWMRVVAGRLKSDYRYSVNIVYNNFPWCEPTDAQKAAIEKTAQAILDARALYPDCSLADLYDEATMPPELRKAHQANDRAVMKAYGYNPSITEPEIVADLMKRYQELGIKGK